MRKIYLLKILLLAALWASGQAKRDLLPQIVPKSPDIAAIETYGNLPVSESSGTADVSIPLANISIGNFILPISLSYHKNGMKTDEVPSSVGDGWTLNYTGAISFQQRGVNDFKTYGMFDGGLSSGALTLMRSMFRGQLTSYQKWNYLEQVIAGNLDSEFDQYNYNLFGKSGAYYYDTLMKVVTQPKADILISRTDTAITIKDEKGNTYIFSTIENSSLQSSADIEMRPSFNDVSAYYLSRVITTQNRIILFKYKTYSYLASIPKTYIGFVQSSPNPDCMSSKGVFSNDELITTGVLLPDSIIYDQGYVKFGISGTYRADIKTLQAAANVPFVTGFTQYNYNGDKIKEYTFTQGYFGTNRRLKLSGINEMNGTYIDKIWLFDYYENGWTCPLLYSLDKDHWGYFNAAANSSLIPNIDYSTIIPNWTTFTQTSGNRNSSGASVYGMLRKVRYPTGGIDSIEYEPNQVKLRSYADISSLSPFFNSTDGISFAPLAGAATSATNMTVSGSFVVPVTLGSTQTIVSIRGFMALDPTHFSDPLHSFTGPSGSDVTAFYHAMEQNVSGNQSGTTIVTSLMPGTYTYSLSAGTDYGSPPVLYQTNFDISVQQYNTGIPYILGGVRVIRTVKNDSTGSPLSYRIYTYSDSLNAVTFRNIPNYISMSSLNAPGQAPIPPSVCVPCGFKYNVFGENAVPSAGPTLEYAYVKVYDSSASGILGKTENTYLASIGEYGSFVEPYVAPINRTWQSGCLLNKKVYKLSGGLYSLVQETANAFTSTINANVSMGFKTNYATYCQATAPENEVYNVSLSTNFTTQYNLLQSKVMDYLSGKRVVNQTDYSITSTAHTLPSIAATLTSTGEQLKTKTVYSFDYDTSSATTADGRGIRMLRRTNILVPIEVIQYRNIGGVDYVVAGTLTTYAEDRPFPSMSYSLRIVDPVPLSSFAFASMSGGSFVFDSRYKPELKYTSYDDKNNFTSLTPANGSTTSFLYDYQKLYPVAEVHNAEATEIYYTSFEAEQKGNWVFAGTPVADATSPTGTKCYNTAAGAITATGLVAAQTYLLSYWTKNSTAFSITGTVSGYPIKGRSVDGWTLFTHKITGLTSVSVSGGLVDELRLYPADAQMTTYTYIPHLNVTTICDENNRTKYFSYDKTGRAVMLRDLDKNIVKIGLYQYLISITQ